MRVSSVFIIGVLCGVLINFVYKLVILFLKCTEISNRKIIFTNES